MDHPNHQGVEGYEEYLEKYTGTQVQDLAAVLPSQAVNLVLPPSRPSARFARNSIYPEHGPDDVWCSITLASCPLGTRTCSRAFSIFSPWSFFSKFSGSDVWIAQPNGYDVSTND